MKTNFTFLFLVVFGSSVLNCQELQAQNSNDQKAKITLERVYAHFSIPNSLLLRETYPFDQDYQASYLDQSEQKSQANQYSYLWPFSGSLSAQVSRYESTADSAILKAIDQQVLPGLEEYFDKREPYGYASYVNTAKESDRFYDDNVWLGIDFTDLYLLTKQDKYLKKAELIWDFVESGMDDKLGGGIYWVEQNKSSKNTCSNAPGAVFVLKLYQATQNPKYLEVGKSLYNWTQSHLQDSTDKLYFDNINLNGKVDQRKYPYNSGQMLQAAVLLYEITKDANYLKQAQEIAQSAHEYFFLPEADHQGKKFKLLKNSDSWFIAVMLRGFKALYEVDHNPLYLNTFQANLDYAWNTLRDDKGLFYKDWTGDKKTEKRWLLDQMAKVEMFARMTTF